jgi:hypothetical protein
MDINHPLYYALKDYYTSLSDKYFTEVNDNSLSIQYIEDTCGIDSKESKLIKFKKECIDHDLYICYIKNTDISCIEFDDTVKFYCCFTDYCINCCDNLSFFYTYQEKLNIYNYIIIDYEFAIKKGSIFIWKN